MSNKPAVLFNTDIQSCNCDFINLQLLGVNQTSYMDCDIILSKHKPIIVPIEKKGYDLYFYEKELNVYGKISIKYKTIFYNTLPIERIFIEKIYLNQRVKEQKFTYTPRNPSLFSLVRTNNKNGLFQHDLEINGEYFGFVSEFGEEAHWTTTAQGTMFLPFSENNLFKKLNYLDDEEYRENHNKYIEHLKQMDVKFGQLHSLKNLVIDGVTENNNGIIEKLFCSYRQLIEKFVIFIEPLKEIRFRPLVPTDRQVFSSNTQHKLCGRTVNIMHGFTVSNNEIETYFDILTIVGESSWIIEKK